MPLFLSQRNTLLREQMDDPRCDPDKLHRTYRQFGRLNHLISRWEKIYADRMKPLMAERCERTYTLLDIGSGGGDLTARIAAWAASDGFRLSVTGADPDPRAHRYAKNHSETAGVTFRRTTTTALAGQDKTYDFVISNHLIHHLAEEELKQMLAEAEALCRNRILFCDIRRSDLAYLLFGICSRPLFRRSFITEDGLKSIRRSYTPRELREVTGTSWQTDTIFPWRLLLHKDCNGPD